MIDDGVDDELSDEELLHGRREPRSTPAGVRLGVAVLGVAVAAAGLVYATSRQSDARRPTSKPRTSVTRSVTPSRSGTPLAIVDNEVVVVDPTPMFTTDGIPATSVLGDYGPSSRRNPDGTLTWSDDLVSEYGFPIQLGGPVRVHVAPGLYARVLRVQLLQAGVQMTPGAGIEPGAHVLLQVRLRVDCSQVDPASSRFPDVPVAVAIGLFGFADAATFVLRPIGDAPPWTQVCPG